MVTLTGGIPTATGGGIDMPNWDLSALKDGEIVAMNGHQVTIRAGDHTYILDGHHFAFLVSNGEVSLAAGSITDITVYRYPPPPDASPFNHFDYKISDAHLDVGAFNDFVAGNDVAGFRSALFGRSDTMTGTGAPDHMTGLTGHDRLYGLDGNDALDGGASRDALVGGAGADTLTGGRGADLFVFGTPADSTAGVYDTLTDFDFARDRLVVSQIVSGIDPTLNTQPSSALNIDGTLAHTTDDAHLAAHHAVVVRVNFSEPHSTTTPGPTPIAPQVYLVVDINGQAGYQSGEDLVVRLTPATDLADLSVDSFIAPILASHG